jgi:hypothetical protein
MKATVKENETFKPITIKLVIESEQELCDLWLRMNHSINNINNNSSRKLKHLADMSGTIFYEALDKEVTRLNLKK